MASPICEVIFVSAYAATSRGGGGQRGWGDSKPPVCIVWTLSALTNLARSGSVRLTGKLEYTLLVEVWGGEGRGLCAEDQKKKPYEGK